MVRAGIVTMKVWNITCRLRARLIRRITRVMRKARMKVAAGPRVTEVRTVMQIEKKVPMTTTKSKTFHLSEKYCLGPSPKILKAASRVKIPANM